MTQSPPQGTIVSPVSNSSEDPSFQKDANSKRKICCSEKCFKPKDLVRLFTNVIICALAATYTKKKYQKFELYQQIEVDAIVMNKTSYEWGTLKTKLNGPFFREDTTTYCEEDLNLVEYLGSGLTSVVYRAVTLDGYDCAVKNFVAVANVGDFKDERINLAKTKAEQEVEAYKQIFCVLDGYVWIQTLNGFDCVVMPFFEPIGKILRQNALGEIKDQFKKFESAKMVFKDCDQVWRHVGSFNDEIYLFDLGDLERIDSQKNLAKELKRHYKRLEKRLNITDDAAT